MNLRSVFKTFLLWELLVGLSVTLRTLFRKKVTVNYREENAAAQRQGRFEQAEGGTLFLDEIGDMPAELQTRLLRVLSDGHYYRVGGHSPLKTKVRIIAATHQDLEARVSQGLFREDLFHRLNVIRVRLPSLRERREDIPILARHFLQKSAQDLGVEGKRFSDAALKHLARSIFPAT